MRPPAEALAAAQSPFDLLRRQAEIWPDAPLLMTPEDVRRLWGLDKSVWSYAETLAAALRLAEAYRAAGCGPGLRAALLFENRPDHFFHWLALNSLGAAVVPLNPDYTDDEFCYALAHSGAAFAATVPERSGRLAAAAARLGLKVWDGAGPPPPVASETPPDAPPEARECVLAYTSGTTGKPKGCLLSNRYFLTWGEWYVAQGGHIALRPGQERLITPLPTFHVNAMGNSFMGMLASGGAQILVDRFHPRSWLSMARTTGATCFHYLGVMPALLLSLPESPDDRTHGLRFGLGGGVHPDHHAAFERRFGAPLLEGWAMTESGGAALLCAAEEPRHVGARRLGRSDRPGPPLERRIVDEAGQDLPPGQPGEFLVRAAGPDPRRGFFSGYLGDPEATAKIWEGGWLHTGDIFVEGADGGLHFVERKKDIIRRSGENISAAEVEAVLAAHPHVAQAAVAPCVDAIREEEVAALIVARAGAPEPAALAASLFHHAAATLAYYKLPARIVFLKEMPTTSTGKLHKPSLKSLANAPGAGLAWFDFHQQKHDQRRALRAP